MTQVATPQPISAESAPRACTSGGPSRFDSIDLVRGVVMVLMALDHTRGFFMRQDLNPLDLDHPSLAWYFTRWVTHFCAPVFVFLAGTGAFLYGSRGHTRSQLAWFLLTRGVWLIFLEFTLIHLGWAFSLDYQGLFVQVIWAIGCSMVIMAGLVFLPTWAVTALGIAIIAGHNLLDSIPEVDLNQLGWPFVFLFRMQLLDDVLPGIRILVLYPLVPWFGILAAGYGFGAIWMLDRHRRRRLLLGLGAALTCAFVVLRYANGYGDPRPWSPHSEGWVTVLSFLDCTKYPPSLAYVLMTLGPSILALGLLDRPVGPLGRPLVVFGRVPLFFYLLHVPLIHLFAVLFAWFRYGDVSFLLCHLAFSDKALLFPRDYGYGLAVIYPVWFLVILCHYPPCRWFAEVKRRSRDPWLSYL
jgi:uncharacterized membrane protein